MTAIGSVHMAKEFDPQVVRQVLAQLEAERAAELAAPVKIVRLQDTMAEWGTRGLNAGVLVGLTLVVLSLLVGDIPLTLRNTLGLARTVGILAIPSALVGMFVGFLVWLRRRS